MKSERKTSLHRFFGKRIDGAGAGKRRDRTEERKEALVLLAIAFLFVANVVLYLCHHYGLTSLNDWRPRSGISAPAVTD